MMLAALGGLALFHAAPLVGQPGLARTQAEERRAAPDTTPPDSAVRRKMKKKKGTVKVSGNVQVFYKGRREASGDGVTEPGVFRDQRVRIEFVGTVNRHVGYDVEVDPRAPEITGVLRDAFITLDYIPRHEIRVGQQKTQFGWENGMSSTKLFFVNRAELSDNLSRGINLRDIGLGLVGSLPLTERFRLEDAVTLVNGAGSNVQADNTPKKNLWGRVGLRYRDSSMTVRVGVSGASGDIFEIADPGPPPVDSFTVTFTRYGTDIEIDHRLGFAAAEYVSSNDRAPAAADASGKRSGYFGLLALKTPWRTGPLVRYDVLEDFKRLTFGAYAGLPADEVSLLLNYEIFRDDTGKHDDRYYARLQVRF